MPVFSTDSAEYKELGEFWGEFWGDFWGRFLWVIFGAILVDDFWSSVACKGLLPISDEGIDELPVS